MNKVQREYAKAKIAYRAAMLTEAQVEKDWIITNGYKNQDGSFPNCIFMLDCNEEDFDLISAKLADDPEHQKAYDALIEKENALRAAEDNLIEYGLSIVPAGVAETLRKVKNEYKYRNQLIETVMALDTRTVPTPTLEYLMKRPLKAENP